MVFAYWNRLGSNGKIAEVVLDRPEVKNAFNTEMANQLLTIFKEIADSDAVAVILRSTNDKAFCTGADLKERNGMTDDEWRVQHKLFEDMFYAIADTPQPVIAVVDGYALAGGFEIVLNCDMIVAADSAIFGLPEVTRGIMPGGGGSRLLPKRIGVHRAKEWLCTGRFVTGIEAEKAGLLNRLTNTNDLLQEAINLAELIAKNAPLAIQACKGAADHLFAMPDEQAREAEIAYYNQCVDTEDRLEGVLAFVEKRPPVFNGK